MCPLPRAPLPGGGPPKALAHDDAARALGRAWLHATGTDFITVDAAEFKGHMLAFAKSERNPGSKS